MRPTSDTARTCAEIADLMDAAYCEMDLYANGRVDLYTAEDGAYYGSVEFKGEDPTVLQFRDGMG